MVELKYKGSDQFNDHGEEMRTPKATNQGFKVSVWSAPKNGAFDATGIRHAREAWETANNRLYRTLALLAKPLTPEIKEWAQLYFCQDLTGQDQLKKVVEILTATQKGLQQDTRLRVCDCIEKDETIGSDGIAPANSCRKGDPGAVKGMVDGLWWGYGDIHLREAIVTSDNREDSRLRCVTVVHEATHKFVGTHDHGYFSLEGTYARREKVNVNTALQNADSFAWFTHQVGREKFLGLTQYCAREKAHKNQTNF